MIRKSASISIQYDNVFSPFLSKDFSEGFKWVKANGFDAVEIIICDPSLLDPKEIVGLITELNLPISTISTGQATALEGLEMTSFDEEIRNKTRERLFYNIDFSAGLGKPNVTIGLIRGRGGKQPKESEYSLLKSELSLVANYAAQKDIILNLEPINRYECALLNSTESAFNLISDIGNPENVGILYDTFHSNLEDADMYTAIEKFGHKFSHVHFADSNRRLPGEGHINFSRIFEELKKVGFDKFISLEVLNNPSAQHVIDFAQNSIDTIFERN